MVSQRSCTVSIGLPVCNAESYLREAMDSILGQTFTDFELIVSDNASTDGTAEICREYAAGDDRVTYSRNDHNIGGARNFNRVFGLSTGEYFKWCSHDDLVAPDYLSRCVEVLDSDPSAVLCHSRSARINSRGEVTGDYDVSMRIGSHSPHERFADLIMVGHFCTLVFGVIRREALARTPLIAPYIGSDRNLLAELGLMGRFHEIPEHLFYRRDHPGASVRTYPNYRDRLPWFDPERSGGFTLPYWRNCLEYYRSISRVSLGSREKALCRAQMIAWLGRNWKFLAIDIAAPVLKRSSRGYKYYAGGYGS